MEILKPNELKEKFNDPWIAPYEKVLTMVDNDKVEIVEYHPCISGSHWLRSEEHTSELQSQCHLVCRLLLEKKKQ